MQYNPMKKGIREGHEVREEKGLSAISVGQTFLSAMKSGKLLADRNVCPTQIHTNDGEPE
jgi:hypothetical protein